MPSIVVKKVCLWMTHGLSITIVLSSRSSYVVRPQNVYTNMSWGKLVYVRKINDEIPLGVSKSLLGGQPVIWFKNNVGN